MKLNLLNESDEGHTCRIEYRKPDDQSWARRNASRCPVCEIEYESELDSGFSGEDFAPRPGDVEAKPAPSAGRRRQSRPGAFGTGRASAPSPTDPLIMQQLKALRDMGGEEWSRRGDRFGKRVRSKPVCSYLHTCTDPSAPMPDPFATLATGPGRHNTYFTDAGPSDPEYTQEWPISKLYGKKPKGEWREFINEKLKCPVCNGSISGCDNPVSTEFGRPKPFCREHVLESPYPKELAGRLLAGEEPDPNKDYQATEKAWRSKRAGFIKPGDHVKLRKLRGTVLDIDEEMADRTHRVEWENPEAEALRITWVDPEDLDLVY